MEFCIITCQRNRSCILNRLNVVPGTDKTLIADGPWELGRLSSQDSVIGALELNPSRFNRAHTVNAEPMEAVTAAA